jgi:hypothetical protein
VSFNIELDRKKFSALFVVVVVIIVCFLLAELPFFTNNGFFRGVCLFDDSSYFPINFGFDDEDNNDNLGEGVTKRFAIEDAAESSVVFDGRRRDSDDAATVAFLCNLLDILPLFDSLVLVDFTVKIGRVGYSTCIYDISRLPCSLFVAFIVV